jgi:hypothetical protein
MKLRAQGGTKIFGNPSVKMSSSGSVVAVQMSSVQLKSSRRYVASVKMSSV